jgi:transcriptional regulator with XRE-family HTH domain
MVTRAGERGNDGYDVPATGMQAFAEELKAQREAAGLTQEDLADRMGYSASVIAKLETCRTRPSEQHAQRADEAFGTPGSFQRLRIVLQRSRAYPDWFRDWPEREARARTIRWFELLVVPGLLQTEDYARALLANRLGDGQQDVDEVVAARMGRQAILSRDRPPELWVVLDEAALRRPIGGSKVMHDQVRWLAEMAARPTICLQVIPATVGVHEGLDGAGFIVADYDVAYVETAAGGQIVDAARDVAALVGAWDRLRAETLPRSASLRLLEEGAGQWT